MLSEKIILDDFAARSDASIFCNAFTRQKANDKQRAEVARYMEERGEINRDYAYDIGLPACGRIKNLGGRIHELRAEGWNIRTDVRHGVCWYVLIGKPVPKTVAMEL